MKSYRAWNPSQSFLLPPSPLEWLPEGHLAYFVLELVETIDLSVINAAIQQKDPRGERPYPPALMVALLLYAYSTGVFSSRKIAQATYGDVAFRVIAGGAHPHFTTINDFRNAYRAECSKLFVHVLRLCQAAGLVTLGHISIDGTKVAANASKHKAMSHARMETEQKRLSNEIEALMAKAEATDRSEDERFGQGVGAEDLPEELRIRQTRLNRITEAKAALEAEAAAGRAAELREQAAAQREKARDESLDPAERQRAETRAAKSDSKAESLSRKDGGGDDGGAGAGTSELPKHRPPATPDGAPKPTAQRNFTDPDSRIMMRDGAVVQAYNAQAAVDGESQVIVAEAVTNQAPDVEHFVPMIDLTIANSGEVPDIVTADNGYWSRATAEYAEAWGIDAHLALGRDSALNADPSRQVSETAAGRARVAMAAKLSRDSGKRIYAQRKMIAEAPFGQIKHARGFRQFTVRGLAKVRAQWTLICATHNLLKLFRATGSLEALAYRMA